ncbi:MAG: lysylphosphatidylglycerol synthase transmembrane domain-containing protein [Candidatus Hydrothermarchaeales archaeon]
MEGISLKEKVFTKKTLLSFIVSFTVLYFLLTRVELSKTLEIMKRVKFTDYILAVVVFYTAFLIRGLRWGVLLRNAGLETPKKETSEIYFLSWFVNCIVPAKLGDVYRAYLLKKNYGRSISKAMGTVFVERAFDVVTIVGLLAVAGSLVFKGKLPTDIQLSLRIGALVSILLIIAIAVIGRWQGSISRFAPALFKDIIVRFEEGVSKSLMKHSLPTLTGYTLMIWFSEAGRLYFVARSIDIVISLQLLFFVTLAAALLTAFPATPAGLGAVELVMVGSLVLAGMVKEVAVSITILDRIITYWSLLVLGGIVYAVSNKT